MALMTRKWRKEVKGAFMCYGMCMLVANLTLIANTQAEARAVYVGLLLRTWYGHWVLYATLFVTIFLTMATLWSVLRRLWAVYGPDKHN